MKKRSSALYAYCAVAVTYVVLNSLLPINKATTAQYDLSVLQYRVLLFSLTIPLLLIWLAGFYGYAKLQEYALLIKGSADGRYFKRIAQAMTILAWTLPVTQILQSILNSIAARYGNFRPSAVIVGHYLSIILALAAFWLLSIGTRGLTDIVRARPSALVTRLMVFGFIVMGALYCYITFYLAHDKTVTRTDPYYLPTGLVLLTIVIPYLFAWFLGLFGSLEILLYKQKVKGLLYKKALDRLAKGIMVIILTSVLIQYITSGANKLAGLKLSALLSLVYALLLIYVIGFVFMALGAKQLKKIEEV